VIHIAQLHKETIFKIPNALEGHDTPEVEIYGMEGVPQEDLERHRRGDPIQAFKRSRLAEPGAGMIPLLAAQKAAIPDLPQQPVAKPVTSPTVPESIPKQIVIPPLGTASSVPGGADQKSSPASSIGSNQGLVTASAAPVTYTSPPAPAAAMYSGAPTTGTQGYGMPYVYPGYPPAPYYGYPPYYQPPAVPPGMPYASYQQYYPPAGYYPPYQPSAQPAPYAPTLTKYNSPGTPYSTPQMSPETNGKVTTDAEDGLVRIEPVEDPETGKILPGAIIMTTNLDVSIEEKRASLSKYKSL